MNFSTYGEIFHTRLHIQYLHVAAARRLMLKLFQLNMCSEITGSICRREAEAEIALWAAEKRRMGSVHKDILEVL